jgi:hypothetical protein
MAAVFLVVHVAWVFFRAASLGEATALLRQMFIGPFESHFFGFECLGSLRHLVLLAPIAVLHAAQWAHEHHGLRKTPTRRMFVAVFCALALLLCERDNGAPFLYFQV